MKTIDWDIIEKKSSIINSGDHFIFTHTKYTYFIVSRNILKQIKSKEMEHDTKDLLRLQSIQHDLVVENAHMKKIFENLPMMKGIYNTNFPYILKHILSNPSFALFFSETVHNGYKFFSLKEKGSINRMEMYKPLRILVNYIIQFSNETTHDLNYCIEEFKPNNEEEHDIVINPKIVAAYKRVPFILKGKGNNDKLFHVCNVVLRN